MKIIFLDWDGVLCTEATYMTRPLGELHPPFDPACIARFCRLIEATGAKVVLSTSWRSLGSVRCGEYLRAAGCHPELVGCTPWFKDAPRFHEIQAWIDACPAPFVDRYVVIDDSPDADLGDGSLILTTMPTGLTDAHVEQVVAILNG